MTLSETHCTLANYKAYLNLASQPYFPLCACTILHRGGHRGSLAYNPKHTHIVFFYYSLLKHTTAYSLRPVQELEKIVER